MNLKNFFISIFAGFIAFFLLGWLFYSALFPDLHPKSEHTNFMFIILGCLFSAMMYGYIFQLGTGISNWMAGLQVGSIIAAISAFSMLFFMYSDMPMDSGNFIKEFLASTISGGITGAVIAFVNGKLSSGDAS